MVVTRLRLRDFRSYAAADVALGERLTVVHGPNGAGKTNLLEALYFGCTGRSCRTANEREVVRFDAPAARVEVALRDRDGDHELSVGFVPARPSGCGSTARRSSACSTRRHDRWSASSCPTASSSSRALRPLRRAHLDQVVAALWPARAATRRAYGQALAQRNALLHRVRAGHGARASLGAWDLELARHAIALRDDRARTVARLEDHFAAAAAELGLAGTAALRYRPRSEAGTPEALAAELAERLDGDLDRGFTGHGPHRDELSLLRDGRELRVYGSQGEQRLALLALLLAERAVLDDERGAPPLLLLDDVMSELDAGRRRQLVERLATGGQGVITTTDLAHVPGAQDVEVVRLEVGEGAVSAEPAPLAEARAAA